MIRHRRVLRATALLSAGLTLLAACGSSSKKSDSTLAAAPTTASAADGNAFGLKYTGGTAGKADPVKSKVFIGYVNEEGGVPAFPEATAGIDAAVQYINNELGGVQGHLLEVKKCLVQTEEDGQKCGTQMVNDNDVKVVMTGTLVLGNKSLYSVLSGKKPVIIGNPVVAEDFVTPDTAAFTPGSPGVIEGLAVFVAKYVQNAKKVAVIYGDNPGGKVAAEQLLKPVLNKSGINDVSMVAVADTATGPDVASAIQAAGGDKADVFIPLVTVQGCIATYDALQSLGIHPQVVTTGLCYGTPMTKHLQDLGSKGQAPSGWFFGGYGYSYFIPDEASGMNEYLAKIRQYGPKNVEYTGFAGPTFATAMTLTKFMNTLGADNVTSDGVRAQVKSFQGPMMLVAGPMHCGANPVFTSLCGTQMGIEQYKDGTWNPIADALNDRAIDPAKA